MSEGDEDIQYFGRIDLDVDEENNIRKEHYNSVSSLLPGSLLFEKRNKIEGRHIVFLRRARNNGDGGKEFLGVEAGELKKNSKLIRYEEADYFPDTELEEVKEDTERYLDRVLPKLD